MPQSDNHITCIISKEEFNGIFTQYYSELFYYAYGFVENQETCRDIVADAFGKAWEARSRLRPEGIRRFLYTMVRNISIDTLRHNQAASNYIEYMALAAEADEAGTPDEYEERITSMTLALNELTPRARYVLEECYFNNKKYAEVAQSLEITTHGVKKHIRSALTNLRKLLTREKNT